MFIFLLNGVSGLENWMRFGVKMELKIEKC